MSDKYSACWTTDSGLVTQPANHGGHVAGHSECQAQMVVNCLSNSAETSHMRGTRSLLTTGMLRCERILTSKYSDRISVYVRQVDVQSIETKLNTT